MPIFNVLCQTVLSIYLTIHGIVNIIGPNGGGQVGDEISIRSGKSDANATILCSSN